MSRDNRRASKGSGAPSAPQKSSRKGRGGQGGGQSSKRNGNSLGGGRKKTSVGGGGGPKTTAATAGGGGEVSATAAAGDVHNVSPTRDQGKSGVGQEKSSSAAAISTGGGSSPPATAAALGDGNVTDAGANDKNDNTSNSVLDDAAEAESRGGENENVEGGGSGDGGAGGGSGDGKEDGGCGGIGGSGGGGPGCVGQQNHDNAPDDGGLVILEVRHSCSFFLCCVSQVAIDGSVVMMLLTKQTIVVSSCSLGVADHGSVAGGGGRASPAGWGSATCRGKTYREYAPSAAGGAAGGSGAIDAVQDRERSDVAHL